MIRSFAGYPGAGRRRDGPARLTRWGPTGRARPGARTGRLIGSAGFTITEAVVALGLTLMVGAGFAVFFRQARLSLDLQPELAAMRQDGRAVLDRMAADLARAGSGLPAEIPVFTDLGRAGNRNPDGMDFLAAPERLAEASFEPIVGFDGIDVQLAGPDSRLDPGNGAAGGPLVMVFNDDEMTPRWAFGRVVSVRRRGGGLVPGVGTALRALQVPTPGTPGNGGSPSGAVVRIAPLSNPWHWHFRPSVDADTFQPGSGGGLLERGLQSVLGGVIEAAVPGIGQGALATLTNQVVGAMLEKLLEERGLPAEAAAGAVEGEGYGLFGLGQPGLVQVERIRYWVQTAAANAADPRRVLMRRVDDNPPQPVGFVEDLQVRYVTGENGDVLLETPPRFVGDMVSAARLGDHIVRAVDIAVRVRSVGGRLAAGSRSSDASADAEGFLIRTYRRRVALRVATAGVDRRAWEELMQLNSLPIEIPKIGPLRFLPLPW